MFKLPVKDIIVNDDAQVRLLEDDGTAYVTGDVTPSAGGFILEGWSQLILGSALNLLAAATRIIKDVPSAGAAEITTYLLVTTTAVADTVFRIVYSSLDLMPTEQQNQPLEKRYQIPVQTTVDGVGAALAAAINIDKYAPCVASYNAGTDTLTLTAKNKGVTLDLYSSDYVLPAKTITTPASLPVNTYDYLKNINWAKNFNIDRNLNWMPIPGNSYNSYYFEVLSDSVADLGNDGVPSEVHGKTNSGYRVWVKTGTALDSAMNVLTGNVNV